MNFIKKHTYIRKLTALDSLIVIATLLSLAILYFNNFNLNEYHTKIIGLSWAIFLGMIMGSYSTTIVIRLPKNTLFNKDDPHCANCNTYLQRQDLYPIFSFLINKGRCRFCQDKIPISIFYTETLICLLYSFAYLYYGFSNLYFIITTIFFFIFILMGLLINKLDKNK